MAKRLLVAACVLLVTLTSPALAQTSSNGLSEEELAAVEQYEAENPGWEVTEINIPEECRVFATVGTDQYGNQYNAEGWGVCGATFIAKKAAEDSLTASQGLERNRVVRSATSAGGSVSPLTEPSSVASASTPPATAPPEQLAESGAAQEADNVSDAGSLHRSGEGNALEGREGGAQASSSAPELEGRGVSEDSSEAPVIKETSGEVDRLPNTGGVGLLPVLLASGCVAVCLLLYKAVK
jgi:hypothetical protein